MDRNAKPDWEVTKKRFAAWWEGGLDGPIVQVTFVARRRNRPAEPEMAREALWATGG